MCRNLVRRNLLRVVLGKPGAKGTARIAWFGCQPLPRRCARIALSVARNRMACMFGSFGVVCFAIMLNINVWMSLAVALPMIVVFVAAAATRERVSRYNRERKPPPPASSASSPKCLAVCRP